MAKQVAADQHTSTRVAPWAIYTRRTIVSICAVIACVSIVGFTFVNWIEHQVLDTNNWVSAMSQIPANPVVATALGSYITEQIFNNAPIQHELSSVLPPQASFIISPLTAQLKNVVSQVTQQVIKSDQFGQVWSTANRLAMNNLLTNARSPTPPANSRINQLFSLNLSGMLGNLSGKLGSTATAFPDLQTRADNLVNVQTSLNQKRQQIWSYIRTLDYLHEVLPFVVFASLLGALALSFNRRKTLFIISVAVIVLLLLEVIGLKIARQNVLDQVRNTSYRPAVGFIYDLLTHSLRVVIYWGFALCVVAIAACTVAGPATWAVRFRSYVTNKFSFVATGLREWHTVRGWTHRYFLALLGIIVLGLLVWLAFVSGATVRTITKDILVAAVIAELTFMVGYRAIPQKRKVSAQ